MLHDVVTWTVALLLLCMLISPRVPTGVLPSLGLGVLLVATLWSLDDQAPGPTIVDTMIGGLGLVGWGITWRFHVTPRLRRRREELEDAAKR